MYPHIFPCLALRSVCLNTSKGKDLCESSCWLNTHSYALTDASRPTYKHKQGCAQTHTSESHPAEYKGDAPRCKDKRMARSSGGT